MEINDLKRYSVIVGDGSGVLFQPMNKKDYTYILTAKHNLYGKRSNTDDTRKVEKFQLEEVEIFIHNHKEKEPLELQINIGESYFPHETVDLAILKIDYLEGFQDIFIDNECENLKEASVCGFPGYKREEKAFPEQYTSYKIDGFISENIFSCLAQLTNSTTGQDEISGLSGGGVLKINKDHLLLVGIQSEISSRKENGQIEFVPVKYFDEIIENPRYSDKLDRLLPPYMGGFEYIKTDVFNINAGADDDNIAFTRQFLKNKANEIIESDITPNYIKEYFKERLLLNENNKRILNNKVIYITWLEFLTIINIVKAKKHGKDDLEEIFNFIRLLYKDTDKDWLASDFLEECLCFNYDNLKTGGTVLIKTNVNPRLPKKNHYKIDRKSLVPRIDRLKNQYEKGEIGNVFIDDASGQTKEFVFDQFNFMHFEFLKEYLLVWESDEFKEFKRSNKDELLLKLKDVYGKLFNL